MSPADRNKMLIAGGVALIAIAVIVFFVVRGRQARARRQQAAAAGAFGTWEGGAAGVEGAAAGTVAPGAQAPAEPGAELARANVGVIEMGVGPAEPTRDRLFQTFEPPVTTPPELMVGMPLERIQPGGLRPEQPEILRVGRRRVAGVLFNERAWAILEKDSETFIVKPGDTVDGITIAAIARDSILLVDEMGRRWQVPLRGTAPGTAMRAPGSRYVGGMPEVPPAAP